MRNKLLKIIILLVALAGGYVSYKWQSVPTNEPDINEPSISEHSIKFGAISDNIIAYWKFDESSGNPTESISGFTTTNNNTVTYSSTNARINNGAVFNSASSQNFTVANSANFDTQNISFSAWVYSTVYSSQSMFIFEKGPVNTQYSLWFDSGALNLRMFTSGSVQVDTNQSIATLGISDSNRYHIVVTYDGANVKMYVNGVLKTTQAKTNDIKTGQSGESIGTHGSGGLYFNGTIDELGIWGRAITQAEVDTLYNNGNGCQYPFNCSATPPEPVHRSVNNGSIKLNNGRLIIK